MVLHFIPKLLLSPEQEFVFHSREVRCVPAKFQRSHHTYQHTTTPLTL